MCRLVTPLALLALLAAPQWAAADFVISFSGSFRGAVGYSLQFDGTDLIEDALPPLLDVGRLAGGSFTASFRLPAYTPTSGPVGVYSFGPPAGITFDLLDPNGAVVHRGTNPRFPRVFVGDDLIDFRTGATFDQVQVQSENDVTGLVTPAVQHGRVEQGGDGTLLNFQTGAGSPADVLGGAAIPPDANTYLRFTNRTFGTGVFFFDSDDATGRFQEAGAYVQYDIASVSVTPVAPVPAPPAAALALAGGLGAVAALAALRRRVAG